MIQQCRFTLKFKETNFKAFPTLDKEYYASTRWGFISICFLWFNLWIEWRNKYDKKKQENLNLSAVKN